MLKKLSVSMILMLLLINNYSLAGVIVNCSINNSLEPSTAKSATIYNELAYVNFTPEFTRAVVAHEEAIITNESWSYTVTANDSSVVCTPKSGIGKDATINVTCKKTGQYTITVTSTINYTIKRYINRRPLPAENKTESGVGVVTLIVKHPDEIKLVDARHVFNYAPMDMTGKWGKGNDEILIGVDNNNKIKLKFIDITGTSYEYSIAGDLTRAYTAIANDTPFEIESTGDAEKSYQVTLKDASGNEATWQVKGFPKAWRDSRISSLESNANWLWGAGCRFSYNLVNTFLKFTAPPNCTSITADQSVTDTRLTHNCGASFNATTKIASVQKYNFGSTSDVSKEISKFKGILGAWTKCIALATVTGYKSEYPKWLNSGGFVTTRAADYAALKAKFDATAVGGTFTFTFLPKSGGASFELDDTWDLYYAIHACTINFTKIEYTYKKTAPKQAEAKSVVVEATISDLYDFDYGNGGTGNVAKAATVQIGSVRGIGMAGRIFQVEIIIDETITSLETIISGKSNYYHIQFFP